MSLYGGIKFSIPSNDKQQDAGPSKDRSESSAAAPTSQATDGSVSANGSESSSKPTAGWSAALKFAPRLNKKPPTQAPRPPGWSGTTYSAAPTTTISSSSSTPPASASGNVETQEEIAFGRDGKALAKAPAMTLRQKQPQGGIKRGGIDGKKKKKKKRKQQQQQHTIPLFDPEEQYDPNRPNDLGEYQAYRKRLRAEKRAALLEEKRRQAAGEDSEGSSYYTDSEEEAPRRDAPKLFAPPKMYSPPSSSRPLPPPEPSSPPPRPPPPSATQDDDPYARRAALSHQPAPATGDDAYGRRGALQTETADEAYARRAALQAATTGDDAFARRAAMAQQPPTATGEDAYARRAALAASTAGPPSFVPPPSPTTYASAPGFAPPVGIAQSYAPPAAMTGVHPNPPPPSFQPPPPISGIPGLGKYSAPTSNPIPPTFQAEPSVPAAHVAPPLSDFEKTLEEKRKAAEAIAAKFKHLGAPAKPAMPSLDEVEGNTWAEKMMHRWGHVDGSGLGKEGTGITSALTLEHISKQTKPGDPTAPLSKRQIAKQKAATANQNSQSRRWVQHGHNKGKIVDASAEDRAAMSKASIGEMSRVVCLRGMVDGEEDVDEELTEEIGEECSKYGVVERVVLHMVEPPPPEPSDCLRIFVVFSGPAGAWMAISHLNGRFFGGHTVLATYFDETRFNAGDRDGEVI